MTDPALRLAGKPVMPFTLLVRLSNAAYEPFTRMKRTLASMNVRLLDYFDVPPAQAMLVQGASVAAIVFRGTEASRGSIPDILDNVAMWPASIDGVPGKFHSGYLSQQDAIWPAAKMLMEKVSTATPLILTGHSMGGAIATITAARIASVDWHAAGLVTFGAPKAINREARRAIQCPVWRFSNRFDFAPSWPPVPWLVHPSSEIRINSGGWIGPLTRHAPGKYITAIEREF